jgi:hypothetical protein
MGTLAKVVLLFLWLPVAFGQVVSSPNQPSTSSQTTQLCQVEGVVVDATTGQPLGKISLSLNNQNPISTAAGTYTPPQIYTAVSDDAGHFLFLSVPPGSYTLDAQGGDYPDQYYHRGSARSYTILEVGTNDNLLNVQFRIKPGVVITGRVLDEDGDPVEGAGVRALFKWHRGHTRYAAAGAANTDDLGQYRIYGVRPGHIVLLAIPGGPGNSARGSAHGGIYSPEFYPGTQDPSQATELEARAGDTLTDVNFTLNPVVPGRISGKLIDGASGEPETGAFVYLQWGGSGFDRMGIGAFGSTTVAPDGSFQITGVPPGSYVLGASTQGPSPSYGQVPVDLSPGEDLSGFQVTLNKPLEMSGRISADPSPALKLPGLFVSLQPDPSNAPSYPAFGRPNPDGTFTIQNAIPGKYRVNVSGFPAEYYLEAATLDGANVLENGLTLIAGSAPGELALYLSLDGGSITGTVVKDDQPVPGAMVALIPDLPRRERDDLYSNTRADSMGRFAMPGLAAGDYKLFAWEDLQGNDFRDPDFIRLFEDRGKEVEVQLRQQQSVELEVIPADAMPEQ